MCSPSQGFYGKNNDTVKSLLPVIRGRMTEQLYEKQSKEEYETYLRLKEKFEK